MINQTIYKFLSFTFALTKWIIIVIVLLTLIHFFVATIFFVEGESMQPNYENGDALVVDRISYLVREPRRGEAVVLKFPGDPDKKKYIKRIIGLPNETISISAGKVYIDNKVLYETYLPKQDVTLPNMTKKLGDDEYFFMGDNRLNSSDSRVWGQASRQYIVGRVWMRLWPVRNAGLIEQPYYILK